MGSLNVYLNFPGNCEEAFLFYKSVFGTEFNSLNRFSEMPPQEGMPPMPAEVGDKLMHVSLPIGDDSVLMGSDSIEGFGPPLQSGNNFSLSLDTRSREEADRLFGLLSEGGAEIMPMGETFWGSYFGMCADRFGINWMVSHELEGQQ